MNNDYTPGHMNNPNLQPQPGDKNHFVFVEVIVVEMVSNPFPPRSPLCIPIA